MRKKIIVFVLGLVMAVNTVLATPNSDRARQRLEEAGLSSTLSTSSLSTSKKDSDRPHLPLRYTINYALGCDGTFGGTMITVLNREKNSKHGNWMEVRFYNGFGEMIGSTGIGVMMPGEFWTFASNIYLASHPMFPSVIDMCPSVCFADSAGYGMYAEIYVWSPRVQISVWGVDSSGQVIQLPLLRKKKAPKGGC